jgi:hypothetical protein
VLLNWDPLQEIDRMLRSDAARRFEDLWYPGADDLLLFDESLEWVLIIMHFGEVRCAQLPPEANPRVFDG